MNQGIDERAKHLADRAMDGSPDRVERPLVSAPERAPLVDYSQFDEDQMLRNRSERSEDW
jgi:hypothetical protein